MVPTHSLNRYSLHALADRALRNAGALTCSESALHTELLDARENLLPEVRVGRHLLLVGRDAHVRLVDAQPIGRLQRRRRRTPLVPLQKQNNTSTFVFVALLRCTMGTHTTRTILYNVLYMYS